MEGGVFCIMRESEFFDVIASIGDRQAVHRGMLFVCYRGRMRMFLVGLTASLSTNPIFS